MLHKSPQDQIQCIDRNKVNQNSRVLRLAALQSKSRPPIRNWFASGVTEVARVHRQWRRCDAVPFGSLPTRSLSLCFTRWFDARLLSLPSISYVRRRRDLLLDIERYILLWNGFYFSSRRKRGFIIFNGIGTYPFDFDRWRFLLMFLCWGV